MAKTASEVKQDFEREGKTFASFARAHGFNIQQVYSVLSGKSKAKFGAGHRIATLLGLKDGLIVERRERRDGTHG